LTKYDLGQVVTKWMGQVVTLFKPDYHIDGAGCQMWQPAPWSADTLENVIENFFTVFITLRIQ